MMLEHPQLARIRLSPEQGNDHNGHAVVIDKEGLGVLGHPLCETPRVALFILQHDAFTYLPTYVYTRTYITSNSEDTS